MTSPIAVAAPVEVGTIFKAAARLFASHPLHVGRQGSYGHLYKHESMLSIFFFISGISIHISTSYFRIESTE